MNPTIRNTLSVISGLAALFVCALTLYPVVNLLFDKYLYNYEGVSSRQDAREKDLIILIAVMSWVFISSIAGGLVCSLIATKNEWLFISICIILLISTFLIISKGRIIDSIESMLSMLMIPLGFMIGRLFALSIKTRRERKKLLELNFENKSADSE